MDASLESGLAEGFEGLAEAQRETLDRYWQRADVEVDGDPQLQQALRFAMFHIFQAAVRNEGRAIPAKGLTGSGYDGHAFWDTESFVLPVLTFTAPQHRPPRARVAPLDARLGARARPPARPARRGPAVAHDPRRGVLRATGRRAPPPST